MTHDHGEVIVRDLGSTNGIRINGKRVEFGRLKPGDELSIAHIRYRLSNGQQAHEATLADTGLGASRLMDRHSEPYGQELLSPPIMPLSPSPDAEPVLAGSAVGRSPDNVLAAAVRGLLPAGLADRCRIQVIVKMDEDEAGDVESNHVASE